MGDSKAKFVRKRGLRSLNYMEIRDTGYTRMGKMLVMTLFMMMRC